VRGVVSAARATDPNSANSQFFIVFSPRFTLDGNYSAFGRVVSGMNYVDAIERGEPPANPSRIVRASIGADNIPPPRPGDVIPSVARATPPAAVPATPPAAEAAPKAEPQPQ
jgi:peptidylprolyl isomerase